jgi:hypothetical protein
MTVTPSSYEAYSVKYAIDMLAASSTFQTLVGATVGNAAAKIAAAKAFIVESYGGNTNEAGGSAKAYATDGAALTLSAPYAHVNSVRMDANYIGVGTYEYSGDIEIILVIARTVSGEKAPEIFRRARNVGGGIRSDLEALFGTAGYLARGEVEFEGPMIRDDTGAESGDVLVHLTIKWEA